MSEEEKGSNDGLEQMAEFLSSAVLLHEMFLNLSAAGFNERQAIMLVAEMVRPR